jgi:hypothetical protein
MSSLRLDGKWDSPPTEAIDFGHRFGFIAFALTPNQYVFPLAWFVSRLDPIGFSVASSILQNISRSEDYISVTTNSSSPSNSKLIHRRKALFQSLFHQIKGVKFILKTPEKLAQRIKDYATAHKD